jgi:hypothetical protein
MFQTTEGLVPIAAMTIEEWLKTDESNNNQ